MLPFRRLQKQIFAIHQDATSDDSTSSTSTVSDVATKNKSKSVTKPAKPAVPLLPVPQSAQASAEQRTLIPTTTAAINSMQGRATAVSSQVLGRTATIRSVPSFDNSDTSADSKHSSGFSSSVNSKASGLSVVTNSSIERSPSPGFKLNTEGMAETSVRWSTTSLRAVEPAPPQDSSENGDADHAQWDSTIGKAGLGKTGRVINKLVSDNDALKREIQIERLRAEEAKQAAKLIEDKMERMISEYESRLLEANVTKTLLARKERQVETLNQSVEVEKKKTLAAQELERNWKDEMEKLRRESKIQVEDATSYAQLMEGRYNAISSHWRDQGDEVKRAVASIKGEIGDIVEERKSDDEKIQTLRDLCEQQDSNIKELKREKEEIAAVFERYKQTQDDDLRDIKLNAKRREEEQERILEESREALNKLKWALNVKQNVKGAQ